MYMKKVTFSFTDDDYEALQKCYQTGVGPEFVVMDGQPHTYQFKDDAEAKAFMDAFQKYKAISFEQPTGQMNPALEKAMAYLALRTLENRYSELDHRLRDEPDRDTPRFEGTRKEMEFLLDVISELSKLAPTQN